MTLLNDAYKAIAHKQKLEGYLKYGLLNDVLLYREVLTELWLLRNVFKQADEIIKNHDEQLED